MAAWTWASVVSCAPSPSKVGPNLSTCPPDAQFGQMDKSVPTLAEWACSAPPDWQAEFAERTAIVEHGAYVALEWAEGVARLDPDRPPTEVPLRRWHRFVDDCGLFLDSGWAAEAAALRWGPVELFGCDRCTPFARIDRMGLLWLLNGRRLVAMTDTAAVIECAAIVQQTYRRVVTQPGRVLAWEIVQ